jgi:ethanolamine utilization protein EutJ
MKKAVEKIAGMLNHPERWDFSGAKELYAGVDIGTFKTIIIIVDEKGVPRAANMRKARVVQSGLIMDYMGAVKIVTQLMAQIKEHSPLPITKGATSYPPQTESSNINTTRYILEGLGLEVVNVLDEPSAANLVLKLQDGAIVDVGGGTTGVAIIKDGKIVYTNDEATGGIHLSLVVAGSMKINYEEAEQIKADKKMNPQIIQIVRPVIDKISTIVLSYLKDFKKVETICLVGGTCELDGLAQIVKKNLDLNVLKINAAQMITPYGIALSCLS